MVVGIQSTAASEIAGADLPDARSGTRTRCAGTATERDFAGSMLDGRWDNLDFKMNSGMLSPGLMGAEIGIATW